MKILIVENEVALSNSLLDFLCHDGYVCETAETYKQAHEKVMHYQYDCILVDLSLPGGAGLELVHALKADKPDVGICIIADQKSVAAKMRSLKLDADEYLPKPVQLAELTGCLRSIIRRRQFQGQRHLAFRNLTVFPDQASVLIDNRPLILTQREYDLLLLFLTNPDRVFTKEAIAMHLRGNDTNGYDSPDFIYSHFKNLRKKMQALGAKNYIRTIYNVGYKLSPE